MFQHNPTQPTDILILSNGPGEVTTWVRPVVRALRQQLGEDRQQVRISLALSPCANASGREAAIAQTYPEIDRVQSAEHFLPFLLWGKTAQGWDWRDRGVIVFLGGDQVFPVILGKRLGYRTVVYGEWETRWHRWIDRFGVMKPALVQQAPARYAHKLTVVGDLMAEVSFQAETQAKTRAERSGELIGLLPGSKPAKLAQGMPLCLAIAQCLQIDRPQIQFVLPVAPTLDLATLARFADPKQNPVAAAFGNPSAELIQANGQAYLEMPTGLRIDLLTRSPAHELLSQCRLCVTTVGANTAELGALAVPMIVLLPTQQLDAMRAWDGLPGLLVNLPGVGSSLAKLINGWFLRQTRLLAWPNIWAGEAIVPELVGELQPQQVANLALDWLNHPAQLEEIRTKLRQVRGESGAAQKMAQLVQALVYPEPV